MHTSKVVYPICTDTGRITLQWCMCLSSLDCSLLVLDEAFSLAAAASYSSRNDVQVVGGRFLVPSWHQSMAQDMCGRTRRPPGEGEKIDQSR